MKSSAFIFLLLLFASLIQGQESHAKRVPTIPTNEISKEAYLEALAVFDSEEKLPNETTTNAMTQAQMFLKNQ